MEEKWFVIDVKKVKGEKSFSVTLGHSMEKPVGEPIRVSEIEFWALAEKLCGRTHATPHRLVGKSYPRISNNPSADMNSFIV